LDGVGGVLFLSEPCNLCYGNTRYGTKIHDDGGMGIVDEYFDTFGIQESGYPQDR
jgi:hypothetical protein